MIRSPYHHSTTNRLQCRRSGFTLIELLIAISIIAVLAGLLLFALGGGKAAADVAIVTNEINELETALNEFKKKYGVFPPSVFVIDEDPQNTVVMPTDPLFAALTESDNFFQRISPISHAAYPEFTDTYNGDADDGMGNFDFNGDGDFDDIVILNGAECLVFFLGGFPQADTSGNVALNGLSANPAAIFDRLSNTNRTQFYEFNADRLIDTDGDGMLEYAPPLGDQDVPYLYLKSTPLKAYRPQGPDNVWGTADDETLPIPNPARPDETPRTGLQFAYYQTLELGDGGAGTDQVVPISPSKAWNDSTFQIVCAGDDGEFGSGGVYASGDSARVPTATFNMTNTAADAYPRQVNFESDNITNFSKGVLGR